MRDDATGSNARAEARDTPRRMARAVCLSPSVCSFPLDTSFSWSTSGGCLRVRGGGMCVCVTASDNPLHLKKSISGCNSTAWDCVITAGRVIMAPAVSSHPAVLSWPRPCYHGRPCHHGRGHVITPGRVIAAPAASSRPAVIAWVDLMSSDPVCDNTGRPKNHGSSTNPKCNHMGYAQCVWHLPVWTSERNQDLQRTQSEVV